MASRARIPHAVRITANVEDVGLCFDETVRRIQAREFAVTTTPEPAICKECDLTILCHAEGIISNDRHG